MDLESFNKFLCEAECIVNSRPLTVENLNDPLSPVPVIPNQLLTMKSDVTMPSPGNFTSNDLYCEKTMEENDTPCK